MKWIQDCWKVCVCHIEVESPSRKRNLKIWVGVYIWNPHHQAHPPLHFSTRNRLIVNDLALSLLHKVKASTCARTRTMRVVRIRACGCACTPTRAPTRGVVYRVCVHSHPRPGVAHGRVCGRIMHTQDTQVDAHAARVRQRVWMRNSARTHRKLARNFSCA